MSFPRVHVGQAALQGALARYAERFDFLEVRGTPSLPAGPRLRRMRSEVPAAFAFSLVVPAELAALSSSEPDPERVAQARAAAEQLEARFILLRTPATLGPSARGHARLARIVELLRGSAGSVAWEPRGVWTDEDAERTAAELDAVLVRDLAEREPPPGRLIYSRLLSLGRNARLGAGAIERVLDRVESAEEAYVTVEGQGALGLAKRVRASNGASGTEHDEDGSEGDLEDDEDQNEDDSDDEDDFEDGDEFGDDDE